MLTKLKYIGVFIWGVVRSAYSPKLLMQAVEILRIVAKKTDTKVDDEILKVVALAIQSESAKKELTKEVNEAKGILKDVSVNLDPKNVALNLGGARLNWNPTNGGVSFGFGKKI